MTRAPAPCHGLSLVHCRPGERTDGNRQTFWIWLKLSSTGVSRPKISTSALTRCDSALISVIVAWSVANGPSTTLSHVPATSGFSYASDTNTLRSYETSGEVMYGAGRAGAPSRCRPS